MSNLIQTHTHTHTPEEQESLVNQSNANEWMAVNKRTKEKKYYLKENEVNHWEFFEYNE